MPSLYIGEQPVRTVALASNNDDATAVAADVMKDKIAYNQYGKIVGTAEPAEDLDSEMTAQDSLIEQIKSAVASKASVSYPTLSNPASAGNIESGYQAIGQDGSIIEGSLMTTIFKTGTFTLTSNKTSTLLSDLDFFPKYFLVLNSSYDSTGDRLRMFEFAKLPDDTYMQVMVGGNAENLEKGGTMYSSLSSSGFTLYPRVGVNTHYFRLNSTYTWYAFG